MYGWHGLTPLTYALLHDRSTQQWRDYAASTLWSIGRILGRDSWNITPYMEFAYPKKFRDDRTADQVKQDIVRRLTS